MTANLTTSRVLRSRKSGLADERGFTMFVTLLVLVVTTLLVAALFLALNGDAHISQHDLDSKRAYTAAAAGANAFLYQLNQNPNYWESCANDSLGETQVPGTSPPEYYSYQVLPANGATSCTSNPIASLIDSSTGSLRMEFTGYSGSNQVKRTIVASYRKLTPLDFAWYTVYEALDSSINGYTDCGVFYRDGRPSNCNINWVTGDTVNGPMYTQDQYLIDGAPVFGRDPADKIESLAPGTSASAVCSGNNCGSAVFDGTPIWSAPFVPLPSDNSQLLTDATNYGQVFSGTTTIVLNGTTATVTNCPSSCSSPTTVNLTQYPLIYITNGTSCNPPAYNPTVSSYSTSGCAGDVYVSGTYTTAVTIAAANNIMIDGNLTTSEASGTPSIPTGTATLGLVANQYIRIMHALGSSDSSAPCGQDNSSTQSFPNLTIDAAILALKHSFINDNYSCGPPTGNLNIYGAIVQNFRGAVGTVNGSGSINSGYLKNYNYDDRLSYLLPPYLFDISTGGWEVDRETLCTPGGSNPSTAC